MRDHLKNIAIVGQGRLTPSVVRGLVDKGQNIVISDIEVGVPDFDFEIDGVKYRRTIKQLGGISAMVMGQVEAKLSHLEGESLIEEYKLIQQKKSKLSSRQRKNVESKFYLQFEEVDSSL